MTYYNTTHVTGAQREQYVRKASNQDVVVLEYFRARHPRSLSPSQVRAGALPEAPLTSVRRSITNLTQADKLVKTAHQRIGPYGRPEHLWRCAPEQQELL